MDQERARQMLDAEMERLERLERFLDRDHAEAVEGEASETDWWSDASQYSEEITNTDALRELLRMRKEGLTAAEERLKQDAYGRSVKSGAVIPDERLEADPLATLTAEEAAEEANPGLWRR